MQNSSLACQTARHRTFDTGKLALHGLEWGQIGRPGLCLLHGGAAHAHWFDRVAGAFTDRYHVVALDQRGHGESQWAAPPAYATEDSVGDLLAVFDGLGWERAILVGHSMGGHNSMACAAWHGDRVRALGILDSRPAIPEERLGTLRARGQQRTRHPYPSRDEAAAAFRLVPRETVAESALLRHLGETGVAERDGGWVYRFDPDANRLRQPADCWPLLPRITAPTLVVHAADDGINPFRFGEYTAQHVPGAQFLPVATGGHLLLGHQDEVRTRANAFLRQGEIPTRA